MCNTVLLFALTIKSSTYLYFILADVLLSNDIENTLQLTIFSLKSFT